MRKLLLIKGNFCYLKSITYDVFICKRNWGIIAELWDNAADYFIDRVGNDIQQQIMMLIRIL